MKKETYYSNISLKPAENGYILCYNENINMGNSSRYEYKEAVYTDENLDEAIKLMKNMVKNKYHEENMTDSPKEY